jgi:hypothetical protein
MRMMRTLTQTGEILAIMVATAVAVAATLKRVEKILRRLISPAKIAEKLAL